MKFTVKDLMIRGIAALTLIAVPARISLALHPLITDDTGTQGRGRIQLELNGERVRDTAEDMEEIRTNTFSVLSYGVVDSLDAIVGLPVERFWVRGFGAESFVQGVTGVPLEFKWRVFEENGLSLALKPGVTLPAGTAPGNVSGGGSAYKAFLIATDRYRFGALHFNLGYNRSEDDGGRRSEAWHASVAAEVNISGNIRVAANTGIERNFLSGWGDAPAFILGGLIYSPVPNIDLDAGVKTAITRAEADIAFLLGFALRL